RAEGCLIRDLESRNGTHVNGRPIAECELVEGDCIDIGIYRLRLVRVRVADARSPSRAALPAAGPAAGCPQPPGIPADGQGDATAGPAAAQVAEAVVAPSAPVLDFVAGP